MAKEIKFNNTLVSGAADETLTYTRYIKDESSGKSAKELLDEKVNKTDKLGTTQLENESVTAEKLAENSVNGRKVCDGSIGNRHIENNAISTLKIASRSVTNEKIAHDSVSRAELTPDVRTTIDKKADAEQVNNSLYDLEKKIGERFVVEGDVTNLPDEEDLTSVKESERDVLKLADRNYAPENFSGKGYKILRRNIKLVSIAITKIRVKSVPTADGTLSFSINGKETQVAVSTSSDNTTALVAQKAASALQESMTEYDVSTDASLITLTRKYGDSVTPSAFSANTTGVVCTITDSTKREFRNILTPIMINQPNTIYEIRYDFDLNGATIEMKEGCTLKFKGGSLKNGVITGNKTVINASSNQIFTPNITPQGEWGDFTVFSSWFGNIETITDHTNILKACVIWGNRTNNPVVVNKGKYIVTDTILFEDNDKIGTTPQKFTFKGEGIRNTIILAKISNKPLFYFKGYNDPTILNKSGFVFGNLTIDAYDSNYNQKFDAILLKNSVSKKFCDITIKNAFNGIFLTTKKDVAISMYNVGYTEMNVFVGCEIHYCINGIHFLGDEHNKISSFHGNKFYDCKIQSGANDIGYNDIISAINFDSHSYIYNCYFDISSCFITNDASLIHINCSSGENYGTINYECGDGKVKITTGDYGNASFIMHGYVYGEGNDIDWSGYHTSQIGEIASYNSDGSIDSYITEEDTGKDKIFIDNIVPSPSLEDTNANIYSNKIYAEGLNYLKNDTYGKAPKHGVFRYRNNGGDYEKGVLITGASDNVVPRLILGKSDKSFESFVTGLELFLDGSKIVSHYNNKQKTLLFGDKMVYCTKNIATEDFVQGYANSHINGDKSNVNISIGDISILCYTAEVHQATTDGVISTASLPYFQNMSGLVYVNAAVICNNTTTQYNLKIQRNNDDKYASFVDIKYTVNDACKIIVFGIGYK